MLKYAAYRILQNYVHGGHKRQKRVLAEELNVHTSNAPGSLRPVAVLELACGGGNLATVFSPEAYYGIDLAADRVGAAQSEHPTFRFGVGDVDGPQFNELVQSYDFIFCHGLLHHLDDDQCRRLLDAVRTRARKPTTFVVIEPLLPVSWQNPMGFILARMDDGDYMRTSGEWRQLLGSNIIRSEPLSFFPRWPVSEEVYVMKFT